MSGISSYAIDTAAGGSCNIRVGRGLATAAELLSGDFGKVAVLTQPGAAATAQTIVDEAAASGASAHLRILPDGDAAKNLQTVGDIYEWLNLLDFTRADLVVGVGGGALTDVAGFAAATYLRGVSAAYLPTTLLGSVDAAIGGKTGINIGGKNLAGVFKHPARVIVDLDILEKLPDVLLREGAAEAVKAGFISDLAIVDEYENKGVEASLDTVVPAAIAVKVAAVRADFREQGRRAILNYGHTIGHAIEVAGAISHGDAVAIGMVAAGRISEMVLGFPQAERQRRIIAGIGLPVVAPPVDSAEVALLMGRDKKRDAGGIRMVLLEDFGHPVVQHVGPELIEEGLAAVDVSRG